MAAFARCASHLSVHAGPSTLFSARRCAHFGSTGHLATFVLPGAKAPRSAQFRTCRVSAISVGDKVPGDVKFNYFDAEGNMQDISVEDLTKGKKVVLIGVPGAFTPTCSLKHLPGFMEKAEDLKAKGVDTIACVAVNDAFVMDAWSKSVGTDDKILMLADGSAVFTKAIGVELDLADKGLGIRSRRYAMLLDDGSVKELNLEEGGAFTVSSADEILAAL